MRRAIFDIETDGLLDTCTKVWCLVIRDINAEETLTFDITSQDIAQGVQHLMKYDEIIGHNIINFDIPALVQLGLADYDKLPKVTDTLVASRLFNTDIGEEDREVLVKNKKYMPMRLAGSHSLKAWGYLSLIHI